ncbi:host specificity protein [Bradyrhizobium macuxiense]|uniref:Host specificity protein n=1 Tax=Bradyrhizobium macuxiense TaxID=1755647 RepID=A0A109JC72_9BRAD|nr:CoA ester lyase [Bradyrhizobium macuxiense]KWV46213.1 host specificity protein [Bradyrhizobium macuxiense]
MTMMRKFPVWRSALFVPANVERFVAKAVDRGADALIIDLEDSVPLAQKDAARALVPEIVKRFRDTGNSDVMVRINQPLELAVRDIESAVIPGVDAIKITKVEGPEHLRLLDEMVTRLEQSRGLPVGKIWFVGLIEAPGPLAKAHDIARSTPRLAGISLGAEDYATAIGAKPTEETLLMPKQQIVQAARAAGIMPLGTIGSVADFADVDGYTRIVRRSADFGFVGSACIHPSLVPILNAGFSPSVQEVAYAERIVALDRQAAAEGRASFALDGKMIDIPIVQRAEALLERANAIAARSRRAPGSA